MGLKLNYQKFGKGKNILLSFHGIGQDSSCFSDFGNLHKDKFTIYAFDLPFHGKSEFQNTDNQPIPKKQIAAFFEKFLESHQIEKFSLMGYSIGGRFVLTLTEVFHKKINTVYLVAPDGISESWIYRLATRNIFTRKVFKWVVFNPVPFEVLAKFLVSLGFVNKSVVRFSQKMLDNDKKRKLIYDSWISFRSLRFNLQDLAKIINKEKLKIIFCMGKFDTVLPKKSIDPLFKKLKVKKIIIFDAGHTKLMEKVAKEWNEKVK
ncbi:Pimeloyl-ACP methyl ester carboxylesterase [Pseudarcicella hirudinis]|uniref:Pimeloyl-ACP methyl ester carboxylesterase n=1 Tax=Pseudarcicella hirudinis TaxID=1079859 RepID=A0A1I5Q459_9BACT|nr:alpha/beta hydrolase [Pseudarcicella hirudinis]SFP40982.1 Pimeloyl-ACP methyl ester carboxylesterase [Pseudarcicella hirudinis]